MSKLPDDQSVAANDESAEEFVDDAVIGRAFRRSLWVLAAMAVVGGGIAVWWGRSEPVAPVKTTPLDLPKVSTKPAVTIPALPFRDITAEAGIAFVHENGATGERLLPETMGGGCAFLDYDNDGDQDILFVNSNRWPWDVATDDDPATMSLYRNDGLGRYDDVTREVGLDVSFYGMGVAVGDFDNDGFVDLFISAVGLNHLFRNANGTFVDVTDTAGVAGGETDWSTSTGWFDYDNDGDLDLFVCNYLTWSREIDLAQEFQLIGGARSYGRPQLFEGTFPRLYRNDGDGAFTDVSASAGVQVKNPATEVPVAKSLGLAFCDFDADGWSDIVVANDTVQNFLFHNRQDGTFDEIGVMTGVAFDANGEARGAMGIDVARFRDDGSVGIAIGNFSNEMTALYVAQHDSLQFTDDAIPTGLGPRTRLELTFGLFFFDCDLDGRLDLFAANGHLEDEINKVQPSQHYEQPPQLFWNCGPDHGSEFLPIPADNTGDDFTRPLVGRGASRADVDGDGDLDILITATGRAPRLLRNDQRSGHHWLRVQLIGGKSNRDAIGARVAVRLSGRTLRRKVMPTGSYLSQFELPLTFGLGASERVERVSVDWPSGGQTELVDVAVDRLLVVREDAESSSASR